MKSSLFNPVGILYLGSYDSLVSVYEGKYLVVLTRGLIFIDERTKTCLGRRNSSAQNQI